MSRLFQSFSQADSSTTRKYGGTGLGLAISRWLAELMGVRMWAGSDGPGRGSIFHFTIRAPVAELPAARNRDYIGTQPELQGRRVLVVDDNETNRRVLGLQTAKWGMASRDTASAAEAVEWVGAGEAFDVAILDMHMPEMDGVTLARKLREARPALPLVLFSSLGRREVGEAESLFAAFLGMPVRQSQLFDTLVTLLAHTHAPAPRRHSPEAPQLAGKQLLVVDDNATNRKVLVLQTTKWGMVPRATEFPRQALEWLASGAWTSGQSFSPSVFTDPNNHVHIVWYDDSPGNNEIYYKRSTDAGVSWGGIKRLTWSSADSWSPVGVVDSNLAIHVFWEDTPISEYDLEIYYRKGVQ